jgi:hypothetical protein
MSRYSRDRSRSGDKHRDSKRRPEPVPKLYAGNIDASVQIALSRSPWMKFKKSFVTCARNMARLLRLPSRQGQEVTILMPLFNSKPMRMLKKQYKSKSFVMQYARVQLQGQRD